MMSMRARVRSVWTHEDEFRRRHRVTGAVSTWMSDELAERELADPERFPHAMPEKALGDRGVVERRRVIIGYHK